MELGRWTFLAPLGYLNARRSTGRSLIPDPERAPLVQTGLPGFRDGTLHEARGAQERQRPRLDDETRQAGSARRRSTPCWRNRAYIAQIDVPEFGISRRGDFEPLITERIFFRVQGILDGRYEVTSPKQRNDPDFPLRGYARCETCGKPLTASWSKGRSDYYAYYHCRGRCRAVNISKAKLEELFVEELARLQPTAGFMRLVKDRVHARLAGD